MRTIHKGTEPVSLVRHRAVPNSDYDGYFEKDELREALVREQRGICCYCMARIRPDTTSMKIEHWHSQTSYPGEQLVYSNLLAACLGSEGDKGRHQHCDSRKGDRDLSRNPANPADRVEKVIRYLPDGRITSNDPAFDSELNEVLNLNQPFLRNNRSEALHGFKNFLAKSGPLSKAKLEKWLRTWTGESTTGDLAPYCQVVVYWLRKRIARA